MAQPGNKVPIFRHDSAPKSKAASYEARFLDDITRHLEENFAQEPSVLHEIISETVHVDIHVFKPTAERESLILVTSGMSDLDMIVPDDAEPKQDYQLAELLVQLPPDWPIDLLGADQHANETSEVEETFLPVSWLKHYARMPHEHETMLTWWQTSQNGNPASPIGPKTDMCGFLFTPPFFCLEDSAWTIPTANGRNVRLINLVPILRDEIVFAINNGAYDLCEKLNHSGSMFGFDLKRTSSLKRKKFLGLF
jgi:hypothetical protein